QEASLLSLSVSFQEPSPQPSSAPAVPGTLREIKKCLGPRPEFKSFLDNDPLQLHLLKKISGMKPVSFDQINVHYKDSGESLRLSFLNEKGEPSGDQVRLFKVDNDGSPTRLLLPEEWKHRPPAEVLR